MESYLTENTGGDLILEKKHKSAKHNKDIAQHDT